MSGLFRDGNPARQDGSIPDIVQDSNGRTSRPPLIKSKPRSSEPVTDRQKWERSMNRWNLTITPTDPDFKAQLQRFRDELHAPGKSPHDVLAANFSKYEVDKFELGYVDKKTKTALYEIQKAHAAAFAARLATEPWRSSFDAHVKASLEFKLAMMYFGLPVEPARFTDLLLSDGGGLNGLSFMSAFRDDGDDQAGEELTLIPEELRPLRFLNYYERRGYGQDNAHMSPDQTYELYYGIPMVVPSDQVESRLGIRGGGEANSSDEEDDIPMADIAGDKNLFMSTGLKSSRVTDRLGLRGGSGSTDEDDDAVCLWSLSGRVFFSYSDPKSFFTAIDRVLGLCTRSTETACVGITVSLLSHPKGQRSPCTLLASDQCYLGRSEHEELNFYKTWLETLEYYDDKLDSDQTFDICVSQISQDVRFSEVQDGLSYRPSLEKETQLVQFSLAGEEDGNLAYLLMPKYGMDAKAAVTVFRYQDKFRSLWRTLSHPDTDEQEKWSLGSRGTLPPPSCLLSIALPGDNAKKNGVDWFHSDVGPTPEIWQWFVDAYHRQGHRMFVMHAGPAAEPLGIGARVEESASTSPRALPDETQDQFYWGRHDLAEDVVVFMEQDIAPVAGLSHTSKQRQEVYRSLVEEDPMDFSGGDTAQRQPLEFNSRRLPDRGERLDDFAKGKALREWSYSRPLSIIMEGQHPSIPINAPPLDQILKTPNAAGLPVDTVPIVSTCVMTPSEQRRLQEAFFEMRTFALNRAQPCPYEGCREYFEVDQEGMQSFRRHLKHRHVGTNCPFCTETLFAHWSDRQRKAHFLDNHADLFSRRGDVLQDNSVHIKNNGLTHKREEAWNFCARCGRDHTILINKADRAQHDNICYPQARSTAIADEFCIKCGENIRDRGNTNQLYQPPEHKCTVSSNFVEADQRIVYCICCALPTHKFSKVYAQKHLFHCKGVNGGDRVKWCPWCGIDLQLKSYRKRHTHLEVCGQKPRTGENPTDMSTGGSMDSPLDTEAVQNKLRARDVDDEATLHELIEGLKARNESKQDRIVSLNHTVNKLNQQVKALQRRLKAGGKGSVLEAQDTGSTSVGGSTQQESGTSAASTTEPSATRPLSKSVRHETNSPQPEEDEKKDALSDNQSKGKRRQSPTGASRHVKRPKQMTSAASSSSAVRPRPATVKNAPERSPADQSLPGGEMTEVPLFEIGMAPRKGGERAQSGSPRRRGGAGGGGGRQQAHSSPIMQTRSRARARRGHSSDDNDENDIDVEV